LAAHDKLVTEAYLAAAGIPHPPAWHGKTIDDVRQFALPLVLKPRFGSWGRDVFRCQNRAELEQSLAEIVTRRWFRKNGVLIQPLLASPGFDLRLIIAGGTTVGAIERVARPGEWRTNISVGGTIRPAHLSTEACELAAAAAAALGADLIGVDLLPTEDGYTVLELNGAVEFDARYSLFGGDVYEAVAQGLGLRAQPDLARSGGKVTPRAPARAR
jgi:[lysine-biosynthesis-protein LysW]--L-2-aminoadipate ligase